MLRALLCVWFLFSAASAGAQPSLYAQSIQASLSESSRNVELLLMDLPTKRVLASTFTDPQKPIPPGSLVKPFLALGYARSHQGVFPTLTCRGRVDRCWSGAGHGSLSLTTAIEQSCNAYFLALAGDLDADAIPFLPAPPADASAEDLVGLTPKWLISPYEIVRAYGMLLSMSRSDTVNKIVVGMHAAAARGTARRIGLRAGGVLAKTGTAPCIDPVCPASGDGLIVAAFPARNPTLLLLVRVRGTTGAMAAVKARRILDRLAAMHVR